MPEIRFNIDHSLDHFIKKAIIRSELGPYWRSRADPNFLCRVLFPAKSAKYAAISPN